MLVMYIRFSFRRLLDQHVLRRWHVLIRIVGVSVTVGLRLLDQVPKKPSPDR